MSLVTKGILTQQLPWGLVLLGVFTSILMEIIGVPALAFAVGMYLPLESTTPSSWAGWRASSWTGGAARRRSRTPARACSTARAWSRADRSWACSRVALAAPELEARRRGASAFGNAGAARGWSGSLAFLGVAYLIYRTALGRAAGRPPDRARRAARGEGRLHRDARRGEDHALLRPGRRPQAPGRARGHGQGSRAALAAAHQPQDLARGPDLDPDDAGGGGDPLRPPTTQVVVCDRSALDNYAYMVLACGRQTAFERFVAHWMKTYDLLFKVPDLGRGLGGRRARHRRVLHALDRPARGPAAAAHEGALRVPAGRRARALVRRVREEVQRHPEMARLF